MVRGARTWWLYIPVLIPLLLAIFWIFLPARFTPNDEPAFEAWQRARIERFEARDGRRKPLSGVSRPGSAWDSYESLFTVYGVHGAAGAADLKMVLRFPRDKTAKVPAASLSNAESIRSTTAGSLETLRNAADCELGSRSVPWTSGLSWDRPFCAGHSIAVSLLLLESRDRRLAGDLTGAIDEAARALQVALDSQFDPVRFCTGCPSEVALAADELDLIATELELTRTQADRLESLASIAEDQLPSLSQALDAYLPALLYGYVKDWEASGNRKRLFQPAPDPPSEWCRSIDRMSPPPTDLEKLTRDDAYLKCEVAHRAWELHRGRAVVHTINEVNSHDGQLRLCHGKLRQLRALMLLRRGMTPTDVAWPMDPFTLKPMSVGGDASTLSLELRQCEPKLLRRDLVHAR